MIILNGHAFAAHREAQLREQVAAWKLQTGRTIRVAAILFQEDAGSQLYTRLKKEAAQRVGIEYVVYTFSFADDIQQILEQLRHLNADSHVTGIIIQKPWRKTWQSVLEEAGAQISPEAYNEWWSTLVMAIDPNKDVDGLHPETHAAIASGRWQEAGKVIPATVRAVWTILLEAGHGTLPAGKYLIIGKSDLLGNPLAALLKNAGCDVELFGKKQLQEKLEKSGDLSDFDVIISSTGHANLIKGEWLPDGVVVVDVGEPKGDVDRASVGEKPSFLTPVPGGVGPLTVVSLLENALSLAVK